MLTPSMGRITGSWYNPLTDKHEIVQHNVGTQSCKRLNNQLVKSNPLTSLSLARSKYDPLKDNYEEYLSENGNYPKHFDKMPQLKHLYKYIGLDEKGNIVKTVSKLHRVGDLRDLLS